MCCNTTHLAVVVDNAQCVYLFCIVLESRMRTTHYHLLYSHVIGRWPSRRYIPILEHHPTTLPYYGRATILYVTVPHSTLRYSSLLYVALCCATLRHVTLHYVTLQCGTIRYLPLRYSTLQYDALRYVIWPPAQRYMQLRRNNCSYGGQMPLRRTTKMSIRRI